LVIRRIFGFYGGGKVIMDIESIQNQLFIERSEEFLKKFHIKKMIMNKGLLSVWRNFSEKKC